MNKLMKNKKALLIAAGVLLTAVILYFAIPFSWPTSITGVDMAALDYDESGVSPLTSFRLHAEGDFTLEQLREAITATPQIGYDLVQEDDNAYILTPFRPLDAGSELVFAIGRDTFSFTVRNELVVISAFPADGSRRVPSHSGVEFTFNTRSLDIESLREAFSINPAYEGSFSVSDSRYVFYPSGNLSPGMEYTVTLNAGLASDEGAVLAADYILRFTTATPEEEAADSMFQIAGNGVSVNSLSDELPIIQAYIDRSILLPGQTLDITLRAFDDWTYYRDALLKNIARPDGLHVVTEIPDEGLREFATMQLEPIHAQQSSSDGWDRGLRIIQLPETLPAGWYAVDIALTVGEVDVTRSILLQVSDISVFYMGVGDDLLAWINDAATGEAVENAQVTFSGAVMASGITDSQGVARLLNNLPQPTDIGYRKEGTLLTITAGEQVYVDVDLFYNADFSANRAMREHISYLFTDRPIYHTSDIIQVWGSVRPRDPAAGSVPGHVTLSLSGGMVKQTAATNPDGTFTATLEFENMSADSWAGLILELEGEELTNRYLRIEDYIKPVYAAEFGTANPVTLAYESIVDVPITIDVSMFDGTPASSFGIEISSWSENITFVHDGVNAERLQITTDENGNISAALRIVENDKDTWHPWMYSYQIQSTDAVSESIYQYKNAAVIHRDLMLTGKARRDGDSGMLEVATNRIDISRITDESQVGWYWNDDDLRGSAVNAEVEAVITRVWYTKEVTGTHYDFISRQTVESFKYVENKEVVDTRRVATTNGTYTLTGLPWSDRESHYYVELKSADSRGRSVVQTVHLGVGYDRFSAFDSGTHDYMLMKNAWTGDSDIRGYYYPHSHTFGDREDVTFILTDNDVPVEAMSGRMIYSVAQEGISHVTVTGSPTVTLPFSEQLVPNYTITGAYFDGKHIFALQSTYLSFDPALRELDIDIQTDSEVYSPGDDVAVSVTVTSKETGAPAVDTAVVVAVVDEAVFAIQEQDISILSRMYQQKLFPYVRKYTSYLQIDMGGPGEMGGGGGSGLRTDFADTAYFGALRTDSAGRASLTATLPDNITGWRVTSLAVTDTGHAGSAKTSVSATKPFFVMPIISETLLVGDTVAIGLRSAGTGVGAQDRVGYKVTVRGDNIAEMSAEVEAGVRDYAAVQFDRLPAGIYTVTVEGNAGEYYDGVRLTMSVIQSGIELPRVETFDLADGVNVHPLRYPVNIKLYSAGSKTASAVLSNIQQTPHSGRADVRIAKKYAAMWFERQGAQWYDQVALADRMEDISRHSMFPLFPYEQPDRELTVKAYLAAPEIVSHGVLVDVANNTWAEITGARSTVYLARALLGRELGADLNRILENSVNLDFVDKMYITMAMAASGDADGALIWYSKLVTPYLEEITGVSGERALYIGGPGGESYPTESTAAASMLATMLGTPDAEGLILYLAHVKSPYNPYLLEQIYYLSKLSENAETSPASFTYRRDGQVRTVELNGGMHYLSFNADQLREANFAVQSGQVFADVYYAAAPDTADTAQKRIGLTKTIEPVGGEFAAGELVRITLIPDLAGLDSDIGSATMRLDDYIPSGMRFEGFEPNDSGEDRGWYPIGRQGQRVQFWLHGAEIGVKIQPIVYYARSATPGDYVVESAYITSGSSGLWGASERGNVTVR